MAYRIKTMGGMGAEILLNVLVVFRDFLVWFLILAFLGVCL
jgi:hypothetical protein